MLNNYLQFIFHLILTKVELMLNQKWYWKVKLLGHAIFGQDRENPIIQEYDRK